LVNVQVNDILTTKNKRELKLITDKISDFNPDKIFIKYPFRVLRNEHDQIGFRIG